MTQTALVQTRIEPELKERIEKTFKRLGLTTSEAIRLFCNQVDIEQGMPFKSKIPNKRLRESMDDVKYRRNLTAYNSLEDFKKAYGFEE